MSYTTDGYTDATFTDGGSRSRSSKKRRARGEWPEVRKFSDLSEPAEAPPPPPDPTPLYDALPDEERQRVDTLVLELKELRAMSAAATPQGGQ